MAVRAHGPGSATPVRQMAVESGRSVLRAANPGQPALKMTRANETMMRAVAVFVGRTVRGASPRLGLTRLCGRLRAVVTGTEVNDSRWKGIFLGERCWKIVGTRHPSIGGTTPKIDLQPGPLRNPPHSTVGGDMIRTPPRQKTPKESR